LPRKLGQHFLIRDSLLERLAEAACGLHSARVIEIGPGRGALTRHLLPHTDELHAIELDGALISYLQTRFRDEPKLQIHHANVLEADLTQWGAASITGNLPYYITSPIIEKFFALDARFAKAVFLMQWEVAQRILAAPGSRDYGYLSVLTQLICDVELILKAPPAAFSPPPRVDSAAVRFTRKPAVASDLHSLLELVSRSFAHKRKTLRNNLRPFYGALVDTLPEAPLRAEQLSVEHFIDLHARLQSLC
jgi:16S rRNA (adenine1518-N6/adenine1519-N6)-dimethyltransferase